MVFLLGMAIAILGTAAGAIVQVIAMGFLVFFAVLVGGGARWAKIAFLAGGIMGIVTGLIVLLAG